MTPEAQGGAFCFYGRFKTDVEPRWKITCVTAITGRLLFVTHTALVGISLLKSFSVMAVKAEVYKISREYPAQKVSIFLFSYGIDMHLHRYGMAGKAGHDRFRTRPIGGDSVLHGSSQYTVLPVHRSTYRWFITMAAVTQLIDVAIKSQFRYLFCNMTFGAVFTRPVWVDQLRR